MYSFDNEYLFISYLLFHQRQTASSMVPYLFYMF